jgi:hypothetical protein
MNMSSEEAMRWSYKTEHFSLKKEGLLGSAFLDEAEIEISLNEFGKAGWELVSFMEVNDGMIAVFKQPLNKGFAPVVEQCKDETFTEQAPETSEIFVENHETIQSIEQNEEDIGDIKIF